MPLDFSTAGYLLAIPTLVFCLGWLLPNRFSNRFSTFIFWLNRLLIIVLAVVFASNVFLYKEWQTLLNHRAMAYLRTPSAMLDSMSFAFQIGSVLLAAALFFLWFKIYEKVVGRAVFPEEKWRWSAVFSPLIFGVLAFAIRGGAGVMPVNESAVYFSQNLVENHAATNTAWHFGHSLVEARAERNPYIFMENEKAKAIRDSIFQIGFCKIAPADFFPGKPNLVLVIMESMTAQVIESLGGEPGICPNLNRLASEGISFQNIYSSGFRTDQGLVSLLSGYPAQPDQSVILLEDKMQKLPALPRIFKENGYKTAFFYGGETTFANMGVYLNHAGFEKIISENDFSEAEKTQRWGVDDFRFLQKVADDLDKMPQPFFASALTLSLHPPFDVPDFANFQVGEGKTDREKFLAAAKFADAAIGDFLKKAEKSAWFDSTVFVFVADHGAFWPGSFSMENPNARQVPLIFWGKPLENNFWNFGKIPVFGNHHDLPSTVASLFFPKLNGREIFNWSNDLFLKLLPKQGFPHFRISEQQDFAYFTNENGFGWMTSRGGGFYSFGSKDWQFFGEKLDEKRQEQGKAYLQILYDDFLKL